MPEKKSAPKKTKKSSLKPEKRLERELLVIVGFIAFLIVLFILASLFFKAQNRFEYQGLSFTKEKYGELPVYHYYYYFTNTAGKIIQYNLYLQHDPRKNNVSLIGDPVILGKRAVYVSLDKSYPENCRENMAGIVDLGLFLSENQFTVVSALTNRTQAKEEDKQYVACENKPDAEVIELKGGNDETQIVVNGNCHEIIIGPDCQVRQAIEKFKLQIVLEARARNLRN
ncbi:MAG TPA: hypothetical protein VJK07_04035 [Candidatus Nanoarchaeia archaeon]|nr:hypothetical protein [Candidatus Nanoarchaeia archaeon]